MSENFTPTRVNHSGRLSLHAKLSRKPLFYWVTLTITEDWRNICFPALHQGQHTEFAGSTSHHDHFQDLVHEQ